MKERTSGEKDQDPDRRCGKGRTDGTARRKGRRPPPAACRATWGPYNPQVILKGTQ
jgi:hypothetical protein